MRFDDHDSTLETAHDLGCEELGLCSLDVAQQEVDIVRYLPQTASDRQPVGDAVLLGQRTRRSSRLSREVVCIDPGAWDAPREPDGVVPVGATEVDEEARPAFDGLPE